MKIRLFVFGAALFALTLTGAFAWSNYDASLVRLGNSTNGVASVIEPGEMGMTITGEYASGRTRTALDLRPPSQCYGTGYVKEMTIYGEGDGSNSYSRLNVGFESYMGQCYSIEEEAGGGQTPRAINLGIADHYAGWNREGIRLSGTNGAVIMGDFAQKTNESVTDYDPIDMLTLHPPRLDSAGTKDSHGLVLSGNGYNNANHTADWRMKTNVTSQAGASTFLLQNRIDGASYASALAVTDSGNVGIGTTTPAYKLEVGGIIRPISATPSYASTSKGLELYYSASGDIGVVESADRNGGLTRKALVVSGTPLYLNSNGVTHQFIATDGKVGFGTQSPNSKVQVAGGDLSVSTQGSGLILKATDGASCYRITVNNSGTLSTASVTCP